MPAIKHSTVGNLPINTIEEDNLRTFELCANKFETLIINNKREIGSLFKMLANTLSSVTLLSC